MRTLPLARLLALVLPLACVGLFGRALYTPDEPREASLVVSMATQADKSLPQLAGRPFAEKPPLLYWLGGASVAALGASAGAARPAVAGGCDGAQAHRKATIPTADKLAHIAGIATVHLGAIHPG